MIQKELKIQGMSCNHCVMAVRKALAQLPGVQVKEIRIGSALVEYEEPTATPETIRAAIEEAGYTVA